MHGNIVLNFMGNAQFEFDAYADAYYRAAEYLANNLSESNGYYDTDACPIIFLYRHAVELYLKHIIVMGNKLKNISTEKNIFNTHNIRDLLTLAKERLIQCDLWENNNYGDKLLELMDELSSLDPHSFCFRYPTDKNSKPTVTPHFKLNVLTFSERASDTCDMLGGACLGLNETWNTYCESLD